MKRLLHKGLSVLMAAVMLATAFTAVPFVANADDHVHTLLHREKKIPTKDENGHIEYWYCADCDSYFLDQYGINEISQEKTVLLYYTFAEENGKVTLTKYNGNDETLIVPDTVPENYPDESLRGKTVTAIGDEAFMGRNLKTVTIPDSYTHIGIRAFSSCTVTTVTIGKGLEHLGRECFTWCPYLEKIIIYSTNDNFEIDEPQNFCYQSKNAIVYGYCGSMVEMMTTYYGIPF